jgi:hypothetical protein
MPSLNLSSVDPFWWYAGGAIALLLVVFGAIAIGRVLLARRAARLLGVAAPPPLVIPVHRRGVAEVPLQPLLRAITEGPTFPLGPRQPLAHDDPRAGQRAADPTHADAPQGGDRPRDAVPVADVLLGELRTGGGLRTPEHSNAPTPPNGTSPNGTPPNGVRAGRLGSTNGAGGASKVFQEVAPTEGTLQFLPGRLEIVDGDVPGRDVRFVRTWGEVPEVTFGRVAGPPYRHVQLRSQTVSRQHARMQFVEGRWRLTNLSQTNPVVVNGQPLDSAHGQRLLREGDEIEMGDVLFRYRER